RCCFILKSCVEIEVRWPRSEGRDFQGTKRRASGLLQSNFQAFEGGARIWKTRPGGFLNLVDDLVVTVRVVMEEDQFFDAGVLADANSLLPGAVSPAFFLFSELLPGVLRIVDEDVGAAGEVADGPVA